MKTFNTFVALVVVVGAALLSGCETESPSQISVSITPRTASLAIGESVEFIASGWHEYNWSLDSTNNVGILSATTGDRVTYTSIKSSSQTVVVTVSINLSTNATTTASASAQAFVTHR